MTVAEFLSEIGLRFIGGTFFAYTALGLIPDTAGAIIWVLVACSASLGWNLFLDLCLRRRKKDEQTQQKP
jgi:hypothetical protein